MCARITKLLRWIGIEICELPYYDGLTDVTTLFVEFEAIVVEKHQLLALDADLRFTPTRLWVAHNISIQDWS